MAEFEGQASTNQYIRTNTAQKTKFFICSVSLKVLTVILMHLSKKLTFLQKVFNKFVTNVLYFFMFTDEILKRKLLFLCMKNQLSWI